MEPLVKCFELYICLVYGFWSDDPLVVLFEVLSSLALQKITTNHDQYWSQIKGSLVRIMR